MTIGWGGVGRVDLEPAGCSDPQCEADHGYTGVLTSDDFSIRVSAAADGPAAAESASSPSRSRSRRGPTPRELRRARLRPRSLGDVVPAVGVALGARLPDRVVPTGLVLPQAPAYVVFLIDGLGANLLRRYADAAPYLSSLLTHSEPGTAGVPSTTATSLTSLGTGLPPGAHGLVGFTSRVPGTGKLLNALAWDSDVDPAEWQPHPTAFALLQGQGVTVTVVNKREFADSGLTRVAQRGVDFVGADKVGERIAAAVTATREKPALTYLYDGDLDWTGHRYGVSSHQWLAQLSSIDSEVEQLREALPREVRLVVVADHGMVDSRPRAASTSTSSSSCATALPCSAARRASATCTATAEPSTTSWRPGARSWASAPRC